MLLVRLLLTLPLVTLGANFEPIDKYWQERSSEAQRQVGISQRKQVKTYKLKDEKRQVGGIADRDGIFINIRVMEKLKVTYGAQRFTLLHEAAHIKNNDPQKGLLMFHAATAFYRVAFLGRPFPYEKLDHSIIKIHKQGERRADLMAAQALQCAHCLFDKICQPDEDPEEGYVPKQEFKPLLFEYALNNKKCDYHRRIFKPIDMREEQKE